MQPNAIRMPVPESRLGKDFHPQKLAWSIPELALSLGVGRSTIYRLIQLGRGPKLTKIGARTVVLAEDATTWLHGREKAA